MAPVLGTLFNGQPIDAESLRKELTEAAALFASATEGGRGAMPSEEPACKRSRTDGVHLHGVESKCAAVKRFARFWLLLRWLRGALSAADARKVSYTREQVLAEDDPFAEGPPIPAAIGRARDFCLCAYLS